VVGACWKNVNLLSAGTIFKETYWYTCASNLYSNTIAEICLFQLLLPSNLELFICLEIRQDKRVLGTNKAYEKGFLRELPEMLQAGVQKFSSYPQSTSKFRMPGGWWHEASSTVRSLVAIATWCWDFVHPRLHDLVRALFCSTCCCLWTWTLKICCSPHLS